MKAWCWAVGVALAAYAGAAEESWVSFPGLGDGASYVPVAGVEGVSGALPKGWRDNSSWSGAKVKYAFGQDGATGYLRVEVSGEGMCQFYNGAIPALDAPGCFRLVLKGRSARESEVIVGVREMEGEHAYAVSAKVGLSKEWREHVIPVSGGPAGKGSAFLVELFSPGAAELASLRLERVAADRYVPLTARPVARGDEWWQARHRALVEAAVKGQPEFLLMGDSITQRWEADGREAWEKSLAPLRAGNFGIDGDGTEHLLWRIRNSGLGTRFRPSLVGLLIGVNNIGMGQMPNDVILGLAACVRAVREQSPQSKVLVLGVFPAAQSGEDGVRTTIRAVNRGYAALADNRDVFFADLGAAFLEKDGSISEAVMDDFLHLTPKGYGLYARELVPVIQRVRGGEAKGGGR